MKQKILFALAVLLTASLPLFAGDDDVDMSNPVDPYTKLGISYGTGGLNISSMVVFGRSQTCKSGIIFNVNDVASLDADDINYRLRVGQISTVNGIGFSVDAINAYHSDLYGRMSVIQAGINASIPIADRFMFFPVLYTGPVIVENTTEFLFERTVGTTYYSYVEDYDSSGGYDIASMVGTAMLYANAKITEKFWALGSISYTNSYWGKSFTDDVVDGGLQVDPLSMDLTVGFQITKSQNITVCWDYVEDDSDDFSISYNYAF
ncbi:MAG: hypothetical protein PQJ59_17310 [Spirochaetales bacterium]|nr:hypothetical protein [Spirochaetales bacterium]